MMAIDTYVSELLGETCLSWVHPSGLQVWLCPKAQTSCSAQIGVRYGSADVPNHDPNIPLGVAHFLEHKVFETPTGDSYDMDFAELGAEVNAYTSYDKTVYHVNTTKDFDKVLITLLSMVAHLDVTPASVRREVDIITEEIRLNRDSPFERCYAQLLQGLYHHHRLKEEICGSEDTIGRVKVSTLRSVFDRYYIPCNMILTVCGDMTPDMINACIDAVFGCQPTTTSPPPKTYWDEPSTPCVTRKTKHMPVPKPLLSMGYKCMTHPDSPQTLFRQTICMGILCEMLFARSGDLYDGLFESGRITPTYSYGYSLGYDFGDVTLSCECDNPQDVVTYITAYIDALHRDGLSQADFERAKRVMYADYVTGFDTPEDIASYLMSYAMDGVMLFDLLDILPTIQMEEIFELLTNYFVPSQMSVAILRDDLSPKERRNHANNG